MSLLDRLERQRVLQQQASERVQESLQPKRAVYVDDHAELKKRVHQEVIEQMNSRAVEMKTDDKDANREEMQRAIESILEREGANLSRTERSRIMRELYDEVAGLGPLEQLLADPKISEIMVNGPDKVYVEKGGRLELSDVRFRDSQQVMNIIDRIVTTVGRRIDEASPMVDARLPDGSRVNAVIPPLSLTGPTITIRKFSKVPLTSSDLIRFGSLSPKMAAFLEACVKGRINMIVSGGTGSGKTTLLNVLSSFIPSDERIVTIEDAAELQLRQDHVVTLESQPSNLEGRGQITIRDLVRNALRMRPDRILVGEVRSGETLDMLQAMNTSHDGSLTTAHANNPRDLIARLETMVLMAGMDLPVKAIREQIASGIDLIVQQARMRDGSRKVVSITEVIGMESDVITMQELFLFEPTGFDANNKLKGRYISTGIHPAFLDKLSVNGVMVRDDWFME